jgi:3-deoxy-D-manno-octulosonic-acid transferase
MLWLYNIGILGYGILLRFFSLFNPKAKLFVKGRKGQFERIANTIDPAQRHVWFHFASLGEFEQGRPVLEKLLQVHPQKKVIVTFFSPSGYEIRKNYALAEGVFYLPLDTASNARRFIQAINPELAIFTKYEYWFHYFKELHKKDIPLYIISGIFRREQSFFKWYGGFQRNILSFVRHFFLQNQESISLLESIGFNNTSLSGDTRFDRVAENALTPKKIDLVEEFCGNAEVFVAGSTWPQDEQLLKELTTENPDWKFIVAPHEIGKAHLEEIKSLLPAAVFYSQLSQANESEKAVLNTRQILVIDNIGMLSALYQYGKIAYIGGGFGVGIHNTLEAAAFGLPVIFGPNYQKFQEAKDLIANGAALSINNGTELSNAFRTFRDNDAGAIAARYVKEKTGATAQILAKLWPSSPKLQ